MSKVLVDRELLENCCDAAKDAYAASLLKELEAILDKPAEAEGTELKRLAAEFDAAPDDAEWEPPHPIFQMARDLDRVTAALSAVTAERDRLRDAAGKAIAWLDAEQNESGVGINRRIKLCRYAENSLRAAMAAKEA